MSNLEPRSLILCHEMLRLESVASLLIPPVHRQCMLSTWQWMRFAVVTAMMERLGDLSSTSTWHTFDTYAEDYARGEGFVALYLKRASDAAQGCPIRAFIGGTAVNANGKAAGITHPSKDGQEAVSLKAYEKAGDLSLSETTYFECHGTGTSAGDPIDVSAISKDGERSFNDWLCQDHSWSYRVRQVPSLDS
jgi:3-oxoacyl-(acyl-carrier-protein) synthase